MQTFDFDLGDYEILKDMGRKNQNRYYLIRCKICGHIKKSGINNLKKQDNHHSQRNCDYDYYKDKIGQEFGDYICTNIIHDSNRKGYIQLLKCRICGHMLSRHGNDNKTLKHTCSRCKSEYYKNEIGKTYNDYQITEIVGYKNNEMVVKCKCVKCGTESKRILRQVKRNIFNHGVECFKSIPNSIYKDTIACRFSDMKNRCNNPNSDNYKHYGARGIQLKYKYAVDLYYDFIEELKREYVKNHDLRQCTFDRIDVNGNYEKSNLRIANQKVQSTNTTRKRYFIISNGKETILSDSSNECGRYLGLNGRGIGNVVRGQSKSCGGWHLIRIVDKDEIPNIKSVTTKLIVS